MRPAANTPAALAPDLASSGRRALRDCAPKRMPPNPESSATSAAVSALPCDRPSAAPLPASATADPTRRSPSPPASGRVRTRAVTELYPPRAGATSSTDARSCPPAPSASARLSDVGLAASAPGIPRGLRRGRVEGRRPPGRSTGDPGCHRSSGRCGGRRSWDPSGLGPPSRTGSAPRARHARGSASLNGRPCPSRRPVRS